MGAFPEYEQYDALGLSELVRTKEISAEELCEEAVARIEAHNPRLNAVIFKMYDLARAQIRTGLPEGPFTGVPFLVKDLVSCCAGVPMTKGSRAFQGYIPSFDCELMKRYKKSGVVVLGKTNTPEFGLLAVTEPELHGPTRNPWNTARTPGGSSGGSAAAIASGMVPMASGGDGGGSIRIPSSYCGLFGLKPSRGRTPSDVCWQGAEVEHVLTRSVRDCAAMLDAVCGPAPGVPYVMERPQRPYLLQMEDHPVSLKVAFTTRSPLGTEVHPDCRDAVHHTARLLEDLGHHVEEAEPRIDGMALAGSYFMMYFGEVAAEIMELRRFLNRKPVPGDVEDQTWALGLLGSAYSAGEFVYTLREWNRAAMAMGEFHEKYDLLLTPTTAMPPGKIGELKLPVMEEALMKIANRFGLGRIMRLTGIPDQIAVRTLARTPFTQLANITGQPAASLPLYWSRDNLPFGSQLIAPIGAEALILRLAAQLEKTAPWFHTRP